MQISIIWLTHPVQSPIIGRRRPIIKYVSYTGITSNQFREDLLRLYRLKAFLYIYILLLVFIKYASIIKLERYELKAEKSLMVFEFISEGPKGKIPKLVQFGETNLKDLYNLAFGDKDLTTGEINDSVVSNNNDSDKVLATVVATVYAFTDKHPDAWVYATGSTKSRTRLYRMGLTKYLSEIEEDFDLYGQKKGEWESFEKGIEYEAFLAQRKND